MYRRNSYLADTNAVFKPNGQKKLRSHNTRFAQALQTSKQLQKRLETFLIFALQLPSNIVSLFKHFGRQRFQNGLKQTAKTLCGSVGREPKNCI